MGTLAKFLIVGDPHLSSKNYGAHIDYPNESLKYYKEITRVIREYGITHQVDLGDFSFSRFHSLEYRQKVENELIEQNRLLNGNKYSLKGNHDSATYGMTELEYYIEKGLIKPAQNFSFGQVNISMVDYKSNKEEYHNSDLIITPSDKTTDILLLHDFFKFDKTTLPNYGNAVLLDDFTEWFGIDTMIIGHIHKQEMFKGNIVKDMKAHEVFVRYPGSLSRPSYREGHMDEIGKMVMLEILDNGDVNYTEIDIELDKIEECFNLEQKEQEKIKKALKGEHVDISDIVRQLNSHERNIGSPEDIINGLEEVKKEYRDKAIEYLKLGQA